MIMLDISSQYVSIWNDMCDITYKKIYVDIAMHHCIASKSLFVPFGIWPLVARTDVCWQLYGESSLDAERLKREVSVHLWRVLAEI